jgi:hypothetical protein
MCFSHSIHTWPFAGAIRKKERRIAHASSRVLKNYLNRRSPLKKS